MQSDEEVAPSSPAPIDIIDLTKESPTLKPLLECRCSAASQRENHDMPERSTCHSVCRRNRLCDNQRHISDESESEKTTQDDVTYVDNVVILDDTIYIEEDDVHYATGSNNGKTIPLTCPICFELLSSELKPTTTRCGHIFCAECLVAFLRTSRKCPTCKANVTLKSCTRLFL